MMPVSLRKYSLSPEKRILDHLKLHKGIPMSIKEISNGANLDEYTTRKIIQSIRKNTDLCIEKDEKVYIPENKMRWWLVAWVILSISVFVACEVAKHS